MLTVRIQGACGAILRPKMNGWDTTVSGEQEVTKFSGYPTEIYVPEAQGEGEWRGSTKIQGLL